MNESTLPTSLGGGVPGPEHRWRCSGCGNLTRFDLIRSQRTQDFWHVDLAGHGQVEESMVLADSVESVTCRWCGRSDAIEVVERPNFEDS